MGEIGWVEAFIGLVLGIRVGQWIEAARWRKNADEIVRVSSGCGLYKVRHDNGYHDVTDLYEQMDKDE